MTIPTNPVTLIPVNLHDSSEYTEFESQRIKCGWDKEPATLLSWREKQDANLKSLFWITIPSPPEPTPTTTPTQPPILRAGHVSLDSYSEIPDPTHELANPDRSTLVIQNFFILPEHRSRGLGHKALDALEALATKEPYGSPDCKEITLTTLSKRYFTEEAGDLKDILLFFPKTHPKYSVGDWYGLRGYVVWKSKHRFDVVSPVDGRVIPGVVDYLRKTL